MKKHIAWLVAVFVLLGGTFFAVEKARAPEVSPGEDVAVNEELVPYHSGVSGFVFAPETPGPHPGIILIHEWWGVTDDIKDMAREYAKEGYVAFVVDLYDGISTNDPQEARSLVSTVREDTDEAMSNLKDAVEYLKTRPDIDQGRLASVGWCFGGGWAYQMAANDMGVRATVMYYGQFDLEHDFEHMKASILGHFGEDDTSIAVDDVKEFQAKLNTLNGANEVYIYPHVGHGFANYRGGDNLAYDESAAELAWQRTQDFLRNALSQ